MHTSVTIEPCIQRLLYQILSCKSNRNFGENKAKVFNAVLGFNRSNYKQFIEIIRAGILKYPIVEKSEKGYGEEYTIYMRIKGVNI